jgi:NADPH:quinone reductase
VEVLEQPLAEPGTGEVTVAVAAAAVNFPDVLLVADEYQVTVQPPFVVGSEYAGTVTAVGAEVVDLSIGDAVHGAMLNGAFAEQITVPASEVRRLPANVDLAAAATFGVAHVTANDVLRSVAKLRRDEELVVLGAGGGVGLAAVELGTQLGAHVTAVASSAAKLEVAASYGAEVLIDHTDAPLREQLRSRLPAGADVVVDPVGGELSEAALRSLRWGGRFVTVGYASGTVPRIPLNLVLLKGIAVLGYESGTFRRRCPDESAQNDAALIELLGERKVRPHVGAVFGLDDVADALAYVANGNAVGKVLVTFPSPASSAGEPGR